MNSVRPEPNDNLAVDGEVYIVEGPNSWEALPFEVGQLFADNGAADLVRYADGSPWTGQPLPTPTSCPQFTDFAICGGYCGPCGVGEACMGRSPLHPYGLCFNESNLCPCPTGQACVAFRVNGADGAGGGFCVPRSECAAIASSYPGGADCLP